MRKSEEKGQGLVEYLIILVIIAIIVVAVLAACWMLFFGGVVVAHWPQVVDWGTGLVSGIQHGDPRSIFIAGVIAIVILVIFFGGSSRR